MIEAEVQPMRSVNERERSESTANAAEAIILCRKPSECPTSWQITKRMASPMSESGRFMVRASGHTVPVCTVIHCWSMESTLCHHMMSASRISPVRGSSVDGPMALAFVLAAYMRVEWLKSSSSALRLSGSISATIAFLKPMRSKATFQSVMPCSRYLRHLRGARLSI